MNGSSPLARGLREPDSRRRAGRRIIPARAGFTCPPARRDLVQQDHPRSRGVYACAAARTIEHMGSSPLARGLPGRVSRREGRRGIIPARAGFTLTMSPFSLMAADHPRSRGVYGSSFQNPLWGWGSSPLARGLPSDSVGCVGSRGIIPARAGFTGEWHLQCGIAEDHPRSRGVYKCMLSILSRGPGSSPLARGLLRGLPVR